MSSKRGFESSLIEQQLCFLSLSLCDFSKVEFSSVLELFDKAKFMNSEQKREGISHRVTSRVNLPHLAKY